MFKLSVCLLHRLWGFELRSSYLQDKLFYKLSHLPSPYAIIKTYAQLCLEKSHTSSCLYISATHLETGFASIPYLVLQGNYKQTFLPSFCVYLL